MEEVEQPLALERKEFVADDGRVVTFVRCRCPSCLWESTWSDDQQLAIAAADQHACHSYQTDALADVLTVLEVASLLRVGKNAVYEHCARGRIPHRRVGRQLRFSRAAIMRWLEACGQQGAAKG